MIRKGSGLHLGNQVVLAGAPRKSPQISRRMLLAGLGGFALAVPFLPSLLEKSAQASGPQARPRFFWGSTSHGGCWDTNMFPSSPLTQQLNVMPGHTVNAGKLVGATANGRTTVSPVLNAASSALSPALLAKMNVLRGLDVPFYIAHNTGMHLGNYARNDGNGTDGQAVTALGMRPTIDQLMATSSSFYTTDDIAATTLKTMVINAGIPMSYGFGDPSQGLASGVINVQGLNSSEQLFTAVFGAPPAADAGAPRPPVVDKVLASYNSLRQSNTRLSAADKARLDTHIAMLAQLQSSVDAHLACTRPPQPTDDADKHSAQTLADATTAAQLWCDIMVAAFACDASRIGVYGFGETTAFSSYTGASWHQDVAHLWYQDQPQGWLTESYQNYFERVFLYMANKLDALEDIDGRTVLDNTLMGWSQECCMTTHEQYGVPVVTMGGASGALTTGLYCDYRNLDESTAKIVAAPTGSSASVASYVTYPGLLYSQWLATALNAMGIPPAEWQLWKDASGNVEQGYGTPYIGTDEKAWTTHYQSTSSAYFENSSASLPFLKA